MSDSLLQPGANAPDFAYQGANGQPHQTRELRGRPFLVYFYPKDDTPGCTAEACGLRDAWEDFQEAGMAVVGVSFDSEASHERFRRRHRLPFGLASDPEKAIAQAFGVYQPHRLTHRLLPFARRISFLIDKNGVIAKTYEHVNPAKQARQVLADAASLA